ncbi:MAG: hypothetical protein ACI31R_02870 [Bacilli bacterium]
MKKILLCFSCIMAIVLLSGCSMNNTPTKKVENFLDNYKNQDETVLTQLKEMVDSDTLMDEDQKTTYTDIMKKQYQDLTYDIKDEVIDGDTATVTAEIEVYDYYKINQDAQTYYDNNPDEFKNDTDSGVAQDITDAAEDVVEGAADAVENATDAVTGDSKFVEYRLGKLKDATDRVKYTIDFTLTKVDDVWTLNDIDDTTRQKIHGLYEH